MSVDLNQFSKDELLDFYELNNFNLLPLVKEGKKPIFKFNEDTNEYNSIFDKKPIPYQNLREIFNKNKHLNVGVIMGKYSGNLFDIDIDKPYLFEEKAPDFIKKLCQKTLGFTSANGTDTNPNKHFLFKSTVTLNLKVKIKDYGFELRGKNCFSAIPWSDIKNKENLVKRYRFINSNNIYIIDETELKELDEFFEYGLIFKDQGYSYKELRYSDSKSKKQSNINKEKGKPYGLSNKNYDLLLNRSNGERSNKEQSYIVENLKNFNSSISIMNEIDEYGSPKLKLKDRGDKYIQYSIMKAQKYLLEEQYPLTIDVKYALFLSDVLDWNAICYESPKNKKKRIYKLTEEEISSEVRYGIPISHKTRFNKVQNAKSVYLCIIFQILFSGKRKINISVRNLSVNAGLNPLAVLKIINNFIPKTEIIEVEKDKSNKYLFTLREFQYIDRKFRSFNPSFRSVIASESNSFNPYSSSIEEVESLSTFKTYFDLISSNLFNHRVYGKYPQGIIQFCMTERSYDEIRKQFNKLKKRKLEKILISLEVGLDIIEIKVIDGLPMYKIKENSKVIKEKCDEYFKDSFSRGHSDYAENRKKRYQKDRIAFEKFKIKTKSNKEKMGINPVSDYRTEDIDINEHY